MNYNNIFPLKYIFIISLISQGIGVVTIYNFLMVLLLLLLYVFDLWFFLSFLMYKLIVK